MQRKPTIDYEMNKKKIVSMKKSEKSKCVCVQLVQFILKITQHMAPLALTSHVSRITTKQKSDASNWNVLWWLVVNCYHIRDSRVVIFECWKHRNPVAHYIFFFCWLVRVETFFPHLLALTTNERMENISTFNCAHSKLQTVIFAVIIFTLFP